MSSRKEITRERVKKVLEDLRAGITKPPKKPVRAKTRFPIRRSTVGRKSTCVWLSIELMQKFKTLAAEQCISVGDLYSDALQFYIEQLDAPQIIEEVVTTPEISEQSIDNNEIGTFYVIQLVPDLDPKRIQLGFTFNLEDKLSEIKMSAPTAVVAITWHCKSHWKQSIIYHVFLRKCHHILNDVYECENLNSVGVRGNALIKSLHENEEQTLEKYAVPSEGGSDNIQLFEDDDDSIQFVIDSNELPKEEISEEVASGSYKEVLIAMISAEKYTSKEITKYLKNKFPYHHPNTAGAMIAQCKSLKYNYKPGYIAITDENKILRFIKINELNKLEIDATANKSTVKSSRNKSTKGKQKGKSSK